MRRQPFKWRSMVSGPSQGHQGRSLQPRSAGCHAGQRCLHPLQRRSGRDDAFPRDVPPCPGRRPVGDPQVHLGRNGVAALIDGMCERAAQFSRQLAAHRFRILNEVVFNQVLFAGDTPAQTRGILANIQASGVCWCGGTQWGDQPAIRISVSSWVTTSEDVDRSVEAFVDARSKARRDDTGGR